jgi:hypothetical protein
MVNSEGRIQFWRDRLLVLATICMVLPLLAVIAFRALHEVGKTNAYAVIADSFLKLTPHADVCYGGDCLYADGKLTALFPPFPALVAAPLVWLNGIETAGFGFISIALMVGTLLIWNRILSVQGATSNVRFWVIAAIAFASPLFYVTLRADGVWFFAQSVAFFFASLAVHEAFVGRRLFTAGLALACALLSRQMTVFLAPVLLVLWMREDEPVFMINRERFSAALRLAVPVALGIACYLAYNYWRFGNPLDTGYRFLAPDAGPLHFRVKDYGVWNMAYVVQNFFYFFVQGFHAEFATPHDVKLSGLDPYGTSFLAASPWLLILFFVKRELRNFLLLALPLGLTLFMLFYHSNGYSQYNTQRYMLDWLPAVLVLIVPVLTAARMEWFRLLVAWGVALNLATVAVLALTKAG